MNGLILRAVGRERITAGPGVWERWSGLLRAEDAMAEPKSDDALTVTEQALVGIAHQLTRIADSLNVPPSTKTRGEVEEAWERLGMRVYADEAVELVKALGVEVQ